MFSFKNVGSYKSTNLAVSETDKQDIEWINLDANNELFNGRVRVLVDCDKTLALTINRNEI